MQDLYTLMSKVLEFIRYKWNIWGFSFSFIEVWFYIAFVKLAFSFIWQLLGQVPHGTNYGSEQNYYGAGISGKAGSHHYGNRKG
jgi:hypothetical protein